MKLRFFDIERFGIWQDMHLDGLSAGLTVVHGPNGSGKTTLMEFVRAVFFGQPQPGSHRHRPHLHPGRQGGRVGLTSAGRESVVSRYWTDPDASEFRVTPQTPRDWLPTAIDGPIFNSVFTVGYREAEVFELLIREVQASDVERTAVAELRTVESVLDELAPADDGWSAGLVRRRNELQAEINRLSQQQRPPLAELEQVRSELATVEASIEGLQGEIERLDALIAAEESMLAEPAEPEGGLNSRDERIQKIEERIRSWRRWQRDVDEQLLAVRSQIENTALADCDPVARPQAALAQARQSMTAIEEAVARLQNHMNRTRRRTAQEGQFTEAQALQTEIDGLRERVFAMCDQLGQHQITRQIAVLEMEARQLQRCRDEISEQIRIMLDRRDLVLQEHAMLSPEDFQRFVHQARGTCRSEAHKSYLTPVVTTPTGSPEKRDQLLAQREALVLKLNEQTARRDELMHRRDALDAAVQKGQRTREIEALQLDLNVIEQQLSDGARERQVRAATRSILEELRSAYEKQQKPLTLLEASRFLNTLTDGEHVAIVSAGETGGLRIERADGKQIPLQALSRGGRDQVALSLRLALARSFATRNAAMPLILDDVFISSDGDRARATARLLLDFAANGQQILFFTCHDHIAAMFRDLGAPVRELPDHERRLARPSEPVLEAPIPAPKPEPVAEPEPEPVVAAEPPPPAAPARIDVEPPPLVLTSDRFSGANWIFYTELTTPVNELSGITPEQSEELEAIGVVSVEDLVALVPDAAAIKLAHLGVSAERIRCWQAQAMLSCRVPLLRREDAELLVRCQIETPEQLAAIHPSEVYERVSNYLRTADGRRFTPQSGPFDQQYAINWSRWAAHARTLWDSREGDGAASRIVKPTAPVIASAATVTTLAKGRVARARTQRRSARAPRPVESRAEAINENESAGTSLRFYLERKAPVEAAPSIGPKTAERLAEVDIISVQDLLEANADSAAERLGHRRIRPSTVRQWQQQAELVCRIPGLRGHDAQILVACEITDPRTLAAYRPADLFAIVAPFVETSEGQRIIRNGRKPDLAEVTSWIESAKYARTLKAA